MMNTVVWLLHRLIFQYTIPRLIYPWTTQMMSQYGIGPVHIKFDLILRL